MKKFNNGEFRIENIGDNVELFGWIQKKRNLGKLLFIDLRDRSGVIQLVFNEDNKYNIEVSNLKVESVIRVVGTVRERENKNNSINTGDVEILVEEMEVLNKAIDIPFNIQNPNTTSEENRLKYRYLDLRREDLQNNLIVRNRVCLIVRNFLNDLGFVEIETPILGKSTPEGARDYLVPSRVHKGTFYALSQSPQLYKQLSMMAGFEKYFQLARCFRDEDLRSDRQPEFTQIDIEMSFAEEKDIFLVVENLMKEIFLKIKNISNLEFPKLKYKYCMEKYGSDKPDTRFDMLLNDITSVFENTNFALFKDIIDNKGIVSSIVVKNNSDKFSRKEIDNLNEFVKKYDAKQLGYLKFKNNEFSGSLNKVLTDDEKAELIKKLNIEENDLIFIIADKKNIVYKSLGALRLKLGKDLSLIDTDKYNFLWVTDFPMFEYNEEEERFEAAHHPFTSPNISDIEKLENDKENCYSRAYDLVLNGYELLSGSVRIIDRELQNRVFNAINLTEEEINNKFGWFKDAFLYGAPPHCGVGIGLERLIMILQNTNDIKDVVAFPKTLSAACLLTSSPSKVDKNQLELLEIMLKND